MGGSRWQSRVMTRPVTRFGLGDALPMHFDVSADQFHADGYMGRFDAPAAEGTGPGLLTQAGGGGGGASRTAPWAGRSQPTLATV
jgi:hypothetical protein